MQILSPGKNICSYKANSYSEVIFTPHGMEKRHLLLASRSDLDLKRLAYVLWPVILNRKSFGIVIGMVSLTLNRLTLRKKGDVVM